MLRARPPSPAQVGRAFLCPLPAEGPIVAPTRGGRGVPVPRGGWSAVPGTTGELAFLKGLRPADSAKAPK